MVFRNFHEKIEWTDTDVSGNILKFVQIFHDRHLSKKYFGYPLQESQKLLHKNKLFYKLFQAPWYTQFNFCGSLAYPKNSPGTKTPPSLQGFSHRKISGLAISLALARHQVSGTHAQWCPGLDSFYLDKTDFQRSTKPNQKTSNHHMERTNWIGLHQNSTPWQNGQKDRQK